MTHDERRGTGAGARDRCPDAELLAEYAEGGLTAAERGEFERHLAGCSDCRDVLAETMASLDQPADTATVPALPMPRPRRRVMPMAAAALAVAAALVLAVGLVPGLGIGRWFGGPSGMTAVEAAVGNERWVEGRLAGFDHAPLRTTQRGGEPSANLELSTAALQAQREAQADPSVENLHVWGVAQLQLRRVREAVSVLETASERDPNLPALQIDLAVAYIDAASQLQAAHLLPRALETLERVLERDPASADALFNRALVLERLALPDEAIQAWRRFIEVEPGSEWSAEARQRLMRLEQQRTPRSGGAPAGAMGQARAEIEEGELPRWASQQLAAGTTDVAALNALRSRATGLAEQQGDRLLLDGITALEAALRSGDSVQRQASLGGIVCLDDVRRRQTLLDTDGLAARARECQRLLRAANSPFALWTLYYISVGEGNEGRPADAIPAIEEALQTAVSLGYPIVAGRLRYRLGILAYTGGRYEESAAYLRPALADFERTGEDRFTVNASQTLAAALIGLGDPMAAWPVHLRAMAMSAESPNARRSAILTSVGRASLEQGLPRFAAVILNAAADFARRQQSPPAFEAEALVFLIRAEGALGRSSVEQTAARLNELIPQVTGGAVRDRLIAEAALAESEAWLRINPGRAAEAAERALDLYERQASTFRAATLELMRAQSARQAGDVERARAALTRGIEVVESESAQIEQRRSDVLYRDRVWDLYAEAAEMALASGRNLEALRLLENGRSRRMRRGTRPIATPSRDYHPIVLAFHEISGEIHRWVVTASGIEYRKLTVPVADVNVQVSRLRAELEVGAEDSAADSLRALSAALLADLQLPIRADAPGDLVIVPSAALHRVPFGALIVGDARLIDGFTVRLSPSVADALALLPGGPLPSPTRVTIVASPQAAGLAYLPEVASEVRDVQARYRDADLHEGADATVAAFRDAIQNASIVHFAGHAVLSVDHPWNAFLALSSSPDHPGGRLTIADLAAGGFRARADVVVLSACATIEGPATRSQGMASIGSELVAAGVGAVVGTLWDVDDRDARQLFVALHDELSRGTTPAEAVRRLQRAAAASGQPTRAWASLAVVAGR